MDKKSKILMGILVAATIVSVGVIFYNDIVKKNFVKISVEE